MTYATYDAVAFLNHENRFPRSARLTKTGRQHESLNTPMTVALSGLPGALEILEHASAILAAGTVPVYDLFFGTSVCQPEDQFVRRIGADNAFKNTIKTQFGLQVVYTKYQRVYAVFQSATYKVEIEYLNLMGPKIISCRKN